MAAGFTRGAIYSNFANKDDLFFALMDQQVARRIVHMERLADELVTTSDIADLIARHLLESVAENRDWQMLFLEFWQRAMRDPAVHERFQLRRQELHSVVAEAFQRALDSGRIRSDASASELTFMVLSIANGFAIEEMLTPGAAPRDLARQLLASLMAGT